MIPKCGTFQDFRKLDMRSSQWRCERIHRDYIQRKKLKWSKFISSLQALEGICINYTLLFSWERILPFHSDFSEGTIQSPRSWCRVPFCAALSDKKSYHNVRGLRGSPVPQENWFYMLVPVRFWFIYFFEAHTTINKNWTYQFNLMQILFCKEGAGSTFIAPSLSRILLRNFSTA